MGKNGSIKGNRSGSKAVSKVPVRRRRSMLRSNQDDNDSENNPISILSQIERRPSCQLTVIPKISRKLSFGGVNEDGGTPPPMRTGFDGHGESMKYEFEKVVRGTLI